MNPNGSGTIRLYHGSPERDFTPTFGLGRDQHDYGRGFYLTEFPDLAREWAVAASPGSDGWLHAYDLRLEGLRIVDFTTLGSLPWLAELMKHRNADESRYYRENSVKFIARYGIDLGDSDVVRGWRANRFLHVELGEDVESWVAWARRSGILPVVTGFLRFRPESLFRQDGENLERGWPTPRSWERVSRMLEVMKDESEELVRHMVYGLVGNRAGVEFMEFKKTSDSFADALEMMRDPNRAVKIPARADMKYALCSAVAYYVWRGEDEKDAEVRLDGFYRICMELSGDFASMLMMDAMAGTDIVPGEEACERLLNHKSHNAWREKHGDALRKRIAL